MIPIYVAIPSADGKVDIGLAEWLLTVNNYSFVEKRFEIPIVDFSQLKPLESNMVFIFNKFLKSNCEYLLWVDNDVTPDYAFIDRALKSDSDIYGGRVLFWQPQFEGPMVCAGVKETDKYRFVSVVGVHENPSEVDFVGFGCVMIKRKVIEKLNKFDIIQKEYWPTGHVKKGLDVLFCEMSKRAGYKIMLDNGDLMDQTVTIGLKHVADKFSKMIYKCLTKKNEA